MALLHKKKVLNKNGVIKAKELTDLEQCCWLRSGQFNFSRSIKLQHELIYFTQRPAVHSSFFNHYLLPKITSYPSFFDYLISDGFSLLKALSTVKPYLALNIEKQYLVWNSVVLAVGPLFAQRSYTDQLFWYLTS